MAKERTVGFRLRLGADEKTFKNLGELKKELKNVNKELDDTTKGTDAYDELNTSAAKLKAEIASTRKEQRKQQREFESLKFAEGSYRQINAELGKLRGSFKELSAQELKSGKITKETQQRLGITADSVAELTQEIVMLDKALKDTDASIGLFQRNVGNYEGAFGRLGAAANTALGVFGAIIKGVELLIQFGAELKATSDEIVKVQSRLSQLEFPADQIDEFAARFTAISTTFEKEADEVLKTANAFSKQFGISFEESTELIEKGLVAGLDANGDFLDLLQEYPVQFKQAGFSANEFLNIIDRQIDQGVFSDKGLDVVKEFGLRITEQSAGAKAALDDAFGQQFTEELFNNLNEGTITAKDALVEVAGALDTTQLPAKELQGVVKNVFGGPGEEVGVEFIKSLKDINEEFDDLTDSQDEFVSRQSRILKANQDLGESQVELSNLISGGGSAFEEFGINAKKFFIDIIIRIIQALQPIFDAFKRLGSAFGELGKSLGFVNEEGESTFSVVNAIGAVLSFIGGIITWVIDLISSIINAIAEFVESSEFLQSALGFVRTAFSKVADAVRAIPSVFQGVKAAIFQIGTNIKNFFKKLIIDIQILGQQINQYNPFGPAQEQIDDQIAALRRQRAEIEGEYKSIGQAFRDAFNESQENLKKARDEAAAEAERAKLETAEVETKKTTDSLKKLQEDIKKEIAEAAKNIRDLKTQLIDDEFDREIQELTDSATDQIEALSGSAEQIKEQTDLINRILTQQIEGVEKRRQESIDKQVEAVRKATQEINDLIADQATQAEETGITERGARVTRTIEKFEFELAIDENKLEMETLKAKQVLLDRLNQGVIDEQTFNQEVERLRVEGLRKRLELDKQAAAIAAANRMEQNAQAIEELEFQKDQEIAALQEANQKLIDEQQIALDNELITTEQFEAAKTAIKETELLKRAQLEQQFLDESATIQEESALINLEVQQDLANQQFQIESDKNAKIRAEAQKTAEVQKAVLTTSLDFFGTFVGGVKDLLAQDEENRKKNAKAIKALGITEIVINLFKELALIAINASQAGAAAGPAAPAVAAATYAVQAAIAIARAGFGIAKIASTKAQEGMALVGGSGSSDTSNSQSTNIGTISNTHSAYQGNNQSDLATNGQNENIPHTGPVKGKMHTQGGVQTSFKGTPIEVESGEYIVRNGKEIYIVNRKSARKFRPQLGQLSKSPSRFSAERRAAVSGINSYRNWGVRFQGGGVLNTSPSTAPSLNQVAQEQQPILDRFDKTISTLTKSIVATNENVLSNSERINTLKVINDPEETVEAANQQTENKRVDNLTIDNNL